jgi:hypothetical protein
MRSLLLKVLLAVARRVSKFGHDAAMAEVDVLIEKLARRDKFARRDLRESLDDRKRG